MQVVYNRQDIGSGIDVGYDSDVFGTLIEVRTLKR